MQGKITGKKKQKLHLWRKRDIQKPAGMSPVIAGLSVCLGAHSATFPTDVTFWFPSTYNGLNTKDCLMTTTVPCILSGIIGMIVLSVLNAFSGVLPGMF